MKRILLLSALAFAACAPKEEAPAAPAATETPAAPAAAPPAATAEALTPAGWGALKIGMTKADVVATVGDNSVPGGVGGPDEDACTEFHPARAPEGLFVMIEQGKLSRVTITELAKLKTSDGFGLGDDPAAIKTSYGQRAIASPHKYQDKPAQYITVWESGRRAEPYVQDANARGFVYEIDGTGKVGAIHAGGPSIQYVEGCA